MFSAVALDHTLSDSCGALKRHPEAAASTRGCLARSCQAKNAGGAPSARAIISFRVLAADSVTLGVSIRRRCPPSSIDRKSVV